MNVQDHAFLKFFNREAAQELIAATQVDESFKAGDIIFDEGSQPDAMFLILEGEILISKKDPDGHSCPIATTGPDGFIGEFGVIDGKPRNAAARVISPTAKLARITNFSIQNILKHPSGQNIISLSSCILDKFRESNTRYVKEVIEHERMSTLGNMVSALVHDFRNPFAVIKMAADILHAKNPEDKLIEEYSQLITEQIDRLSAMTDDVLDFARGTIALSPEPTSTGKLLQQLQALNRHYLEHRHVILQIHDMDLPLIIDADKMLRVIQNIINNAVDAFRNEPGAIVITTLHNKAHNKVQIDIHDTGPGIPEQIATTIFDPFVTHGKKAGTGLGMAIARSIVDAHHGTITFDSSPEEGTCFHILLPQEQ